MSTTLKDQLKSWDGTYTTYLSDLYAGNRQRPQFFEDLVACLKFPALQKQATWLIKHHYDRGNALPASLTNKLMSVCTSVEHWESKLHLLQLIPHFKLARNSLVKTEDFVRTCLKEDNKFVRAWAYNGLYELTRYVPGLKTEVEFLCERAMDMESAAVRSRVRKVLLNLKGKKTSR